VNARLPAPGYSIAKATSLPFPEARERVIAALKEQGFGVLTEIDIQATLREKIGAELEPHSILGACNPPLAHRALMAEPSIGLLLPCNVVVRTTEDGVLVEAMDPEAVMAMVDNPDVREVATEARARLVAAVATIPD
jgi:uncharacterized protein (DUF302 family)